MARTHEALVRQLIAKMGEEAATRVDATAEINFLVKEATGGREDAVAKYEAQLETIEPEMGEDFARRYDASLRAKLEAHREKAVVRDRIGRRMLERVARGEPAFASLIDLVSTLWKWPR